MNRSTNAVSFQGIELKQAILNSDRFQVKNEVTAMRVAQALDRYLFSITRPYNDLERVCDKVTCFNESGLSTLLQELTVKGEEVKSDAEKLKILLSLQAQTLTNLSKITALNDNENKALSKVLELSESKNPIPSYSSIKEVVFLIFFICVAALVVLANLKNV